MFTHQTAPPPVAKEAADSSAIPDSPFAAANARNPVDAKCAFERSGFVLVLNGTLLSRFNVLLLHVLVFVSTAYFQLRPFIQSRRLGCTVKSTYKKPTYSIEFGVHLRSPVLVATAPRGSNPIALTPPPSYPCTRNVHHLSQRHYGK